jgi:hypothetical protein
MRLFKIVFITIISFIGCSFVSTAESYGTDNGKMPMEQSPSKNINKENSLLQNQGIKKRSKSLPLSGNGIAFGGILAIASSFITKKICDNNSERKFQLKTESVEKDFTNGSVALKKDFDSVKLQLNEKESEYEKRSKDIEVLQQQLQEKQDAFEEMKKECQLLRTQLEKQKSPSGEKQTKDCNTQTLKEINQVAITTFIEERFDSENGDIYGQLQEILKSEEYKPMFDQIKEIQSQIDEFKAYKSKIKEINLFYQTEKEITGQEEFKIFQNIMTKVEDHTKIFENIESFVVLNINLPQDITFKNFIEKASLFQKNLSKYRDEILHKTYGSITKIFQKHLQQPENSDLITILENINQSSKNLLPLLNDSYKYVTTKQSLNNTAVMGCGLAVEKSINILYPIVDLFVESYKEKKLDQFFEWIKTKKDQLPFDDMKYDGLISKKQKQNFKSSLKQKIQNFKNRPLEDQKEDERIVLNVETHLKIMEDSEQYNPYYHVAYILEETLKKIKPITFSYDDFIAQRSYFDDECFLPLQTHMKAIETKYGFVDLDWEDVNGEILKKHEGLITKNLLEKGKQKENLTYKSGKTHKSLPIMKITVEKDGSSQDIYRLINKESMDKETLDEIYELENQFIKSLFQLNTTLESIKKTQDTDGTKRVETKKEISTFNCEYGPMTIKVPYLCDGEHNYENDEENDYDDDHEHYKKDYLFKYYISTQNLKHHYLLVNPSNLHIKANKTDIDSYDTDKRSEYSIKKNERGQKYFDQLKLLLPENLQNNAIFKTYVDHIQMDFSDPNKTKQLSKAIQDYIGDLNTLKDLFQSVEINK